MIGDLALYDAALTDVASVSMTQSKCRQTDWYAGNALQDKHVLSEEDWA